jgi:formate-dependent nitrite reductase cytochrome c552 subunit
VTQPRITSITYRRLATFGHYENEAVEATAKVGPDDDPTERLEALKGWVDTQLGCRQEYRAAKDDVERAKQELASIEQLVERAQGRWDAAKAFLSKHGINPDTFDDIPF